MRSLSRNWITMITELLEHSMVEDIENVEVTMCMPVQENGKVLEEWYQWDLLVSWLIWAFGLDESGENVLLENMMVSQASPWLSCGSARLTAYAGGQGSPGEHEGTHLAGVPVAHVGGRLNMSHELQHLL